MVTGSNRGRLFRFLRSIEDSALGVFLAVAVLAVVLGVVARLGLTANVRVSGTSELARIGMLWITFFGVAVISRDDEHISLSIKLERLFPRSVSIPILLETIRRGLTIVFFLMLVVDGIRITRLDSGMKSAALGLPVVLFTAPLVIGSLLAMFHVVVSWWTGIRDTNKGSEDMRGS